MDSDSGSRFSRSQSRHDWPIRAFELGHEPPADLSDSTTAGERLAMMWELAQQSWALTGRPFPEYSREEIPGRKARLTE